MSDVHCMSCREPWDTYHMRHDAIWDVICDGFIWEDIRLANLDDSAASLDMLRRRWPNQTLTDEVREAFKKAGWEFGATILTIRRCPACKSNGDRPVDEKTRIRTETLSDLFQGDLDGLSSELSHD